MGRDVRRRYERWPGPSGRFRKDTGFVLTAVVWAHVYRGQHERRDKVTLRQLQGASSPNSAFKGKARDLGLNLGAGAGGRCLHKRWSPWAHPASHPGPAVPAMGTLKPHVPSPRVGPSPTYLLTTELGTPETRSP